jgi:cytochrome P450/NADPH-cytochrome P450 reductase
MAFSRLEGQPKCYVQDKLWEERERVWQLLEEGGATFYVCGDGSQMVPAVEKTLQRIYSEKTGQAEHESELWFNQMVESNRYIVDSWNTTPTKK